MATPKLDIDKVLKNFPLEKPRDIQVQAMKDVVTAFNEGAEYVALEVPVGGGKSGIAVALARTMGQSYMLTLTEQLQQQYLRDFKHLGMEVLLGRGKFPCHTLGGDATCADGRIMKADCEPDACAYKRSKNKALSAPHVVANYHSYAYNLGMTGGGGRKQDDDGPSPVRDLTVVDECHAMEPFLLDAVGLTVRLEKVPVVGLPPPPDEQERFEPYRVYLREELVPRLKDYLDKARKRQVLDPKTEDELSTLLGRMQGILLNDEDEWVPERGTNERGDVIRSWFALKPLRVSRYGKWLTGYGKRVLLMSGTILSPFHLVTSIGLDPEKGQTFTYDSPFPAENRPVYVGNLDMSYKARDESWPVMVEQVKGLLEAHANEKGLLLCSSNVMLDHIIKSLPPQLSRRILKATGEQRMAKYNEHLASRMPTVLGASGFWEGADLKGDASRFQIIPAVPRPIWQGQVKARAEREAGWYDWLSYTKLMQGFGRSVRSETDTAVTYLLDKAFRREFKKANGLIPLWLKSSIHLID